MSKKIEYQISSIKIECQISSVNEILGIKFRVSNITEYKISQSIKYHGVSNITEYQILRSIKYHGVSNITEYQISAIKFRESNIWYQILGIKYLASNIKYQILRLFKRLDFRALRGKIIALRGACWLDRQTDTHTR